MRRCTFLIGAGIIVVAIQTVGNAIEHGYLSPDARHAPNAGMNDLCTDDLLRLKGTVRVGSGPYLALLQDSMTGRVRAYSERDAVDGGTVRKITRDAVYLDRGGTVTVVTKERSSGAEWAPVPPPQAHGARPSCPAPNAADEVTAMEMRPDRYGKGEMSR